MAVEAIDVVVSALTGGAAAGLKDVTTAAFTDSYASLLAALRHRFGQERAQELVALADEQADDRLTAILTATEVALDDEVIAAAHAVLAQLDPPKYRVDARDAQGVQIGDHNRMTLNFTKKR